MIPFWICACRHSKVTAFLPVSCMKKGKWWSAICNYKQSYKSPCVSSMKLKQSIKDSLCYSESICVHFRPNKPTLQELWTFACVITSRKAVYNHCESFVACISYLQCYCTMAQKIHLALLTGLMYITSISVESSECY